MDSFTYKQSIMQEFIRLTMLAAAVRDSNMCWRDKYEVIFSPVISGAFQELGIHFDWADPDMGYDDDVISFVNAIEAKAEQFREVIRKDDAIRDILASEDMVRQLRPALEHVQREIQKVLDTYDGKL